MARATRGRKLTPEEIRTRDEALDAGFQAKVNGEENEGSRERAAGYSEAEEPFVPLRSAEVRLEDDTVGPRANARTVGRRGQPTRAKDDDSPSPSVAQDKRGLTMMLNMVEAIVVARMGEEAKFTKDERAMIETGAAEILQKISPKSVQTLTAFSSPIMLGTGVFMYVMRVSSLNARESVQHDRATTRRETPEERTRRVNHNGVVLPGVPETRARVGFTPANGTVSPEVTRDEPKDGTGIIDNDLGGMWERTAHSG